MKAKPAALPPNPLLPEANRLHVQSDGLSGVVHFPEATIEVMKDIHAKGGPNVSRRWQAMMQKQRVGLAPFAELKRLHVEGLRSRRSGEGDVPDEIISKFAFELFAQGSKPINLVRDLVFYLDDRKIKPPDQSTLRKARARLRKLGKWPV